MSVALLSCIMVASALADETVSDWIQLADEQKINGTNLKDLKQQLLDVIQQNKTSIETELANAQQTRQAEETAIKGIRDRDDNIISAYQ